MKKQKENIQENEEAALMWDYLVPEISFSILCPDSAQREKKTELVSFSFQKEKKKDLFTK